MDSEMGRKVFISYSWEDEFSGNLCISLEYSLKAKGYKALRDKTKIKPGELWRPHINRWLCSCDGAVILFSQHALKSKWVQFEASILSWRKSLRSGLNLLPILLDGVNDGDIRTGDFDALQLGEIKPLCKKPNESHEALAKKITDYFSDLSWESEECEMSNWIEDVTGLLKEAKPGNLKRAAQKLGIDADMLEPFGDLHKEITHRLLFYADKEKIKEALFELCSGMNNEFFGDLKRRVKPNWVQPQAARKILPVTQKKESERSLTINAENINTG